MATFRKRGDTWRAEIRRKNFYASESFASKAAAVAWATETEAKALGGQKRQGTGKRTLRDAIDQYRIDKMPGHRGARWENVRLTKFERDLPFVDDLLGSIMPQAIGAWRDRSLKKIASSSFNREFTLLTSVFEHARKELRWVAENPCRDVDRPQNPRARTRRVSARERDAIVKQLGFIDGEPVETLGQEVAVAFLLALETAMRQGEILSLERRQVDLKKRIARLSRTKNGDDRSVPLSKRAAGLLETLVGTERFFRVSSASTDALFRKARDAAGVEDLHFHDSRREATTRLAKLFPVEDLSKITGHRDIKTLVRVYYAPDVSDMVSRLDAA